MNWNEPEKNLKSKKNFLEKLSHGEISCDGFYSGLLFSN